MPTDLTHYTPRPASGDTTTPCQKPFNSLPKNNTSSSKPTRTIILFASNPKPAHPTGRRESAKTTARWHATKATVTTCGYR